MIGADQALAARADAVENDVATKDDELPPKDPAKKGDAPMVAGGGGGEEEVRRAVEEEEECVAWRVRHSIDASQTHTSPCSVTTVVRLFEAEMLEARLP